MNEMACRCNFGNNSKTILYCSIKLQSWTKYLQQSREIPKNCTGQGKFDINFCMLLDCYCQSSISGRETGHCAMSPPKFEIFLKFPYFLRSLVLSRSATREATCILSLLYQIPHFVLLVVNRISTKTFQSSKIF